MCKSLLLLGTLITFSLCAEGEVLFVADEFPAMEVLARRLKAEDGKPSRIVEQTQMPEDLARFDCVVVYIHKELAETAERTFIRYAENGGRLVVLHHSISSGKRKNRDWFPFLGVELQPGPVETGGYKWIEDITVDWVNLAGTHFVTAQGIQYPGKLEYTRSPGVAPESLPAFRLEDTEVYLNHKLSGPRTLLLGLKYTDQETGRVWMQNTAGWYRPAGKGWVIYFMPGHTAHDFENPIYGRMVLNAITAETAALKSH
jgi:hypothetical protein